MTDPEPLPQAAPDVQAAYGDVIRTEIGEQAQHVAAGKNILQIIIDNLHLPLWLLYVMAAGIFVVIVSLGWFGYLSLVPGIPVVLPTMPTPTLTPMPSATPSPIPTPLPFAPEAEDEVLIVIATFDRGEGVIDSRPHFEIQRAIREEANTIDFANLRVEVEPMVLLADERDAAETLGKQHNASLVIWGEESSVRLTVSFLNLKEPAFDAAAVQITETERTFLAASVKPEPYIQFITEELPRELNFLTLFAVGQSYYAKRQYVQSITMIERAIQNLPQDSSIIGLPDAYFRLGWLYQEPLKDVRKAIYNYDQSLKFVDTNSLLLYLQLNATSSITASFNLLSKVYNTLGKNDSPSSFIYIIRGNEYYDLQEYQLAIKDFDKAVALEPDNPMAYYYRGLTYRKLENSQQANADYTQAIKLDSRYNSAYNNRGIVDEELYKYQTKIINTFTDQFTDSHKKYISAYNNRGIAYAELGNFTKAMEDYSQIIAIDNKYPSVYYNQGLVYNRLEQYDEAVSSFQTYTVLASGDPNGWNMLCWWQSLTNFSLEVLEACQKANDLSETFAPYRDSRGLARVLAGDYTGAVEDFAAYLEYTKINGIYETHGKKREAWIAVLQRGENPFDEATLAELRKE